ncbi:MAG: transporter substrate-binding domain-containing protein [Spirochaetaceae bacterium]|jgi:polar amino acid transport system substrate-binding protein|nr:transporter substrate-binding domain-containing protein [Spirochaetaceae bacterium]
MKKTGVSAVFIVLGLAISGILLGNCKKQQSGEAASVIIVNAATGGSPRPFTYVDENGKLVGHNIELIEAIFARLPQYKLVLEVTDFPSIFAGLDADRYQIGVNNFAINEERKQKYLFSEPMFKNRYIAAVAVSGGSWGDEVRTMADLAGKTTLNSVGTNMATAIENYNKANPSALVKQSYGDANILVALQQVEAGQYDFNLIDKPMFDFYVRDFGLKLRGIELGEALSGDVMQTPYSYFIVSKGNEKLVEDINKALAEVISDGTSKRICEKYFGGDYSPETR